jgi:predicted methyltransferase
MAVDDSTRRSIEAQGSTAGGSRSTRRVPLRWRDVLSAEELAACEERVQERLRADAAFWTGSGPPGFRAMPVPVPRDNLLDSVSTFAPTSSFREHRFKGMPMARRSSSLALLSSRAVAAAAALLLGAPGSGAADKIPAAIRAAVADTGRPDADRQRDSDRKPVEVVAFAGLKAGDHVVELFPGGGYFTRILSKLVGEKGVVYAVVPPPRPNAPAGAPDPAAAMQAMAAGYKNIRVQTLGQGQLAPEPVDLVWTSLNYHDLHNRPDADLAAFNHDVFRALKPGGVFLVIDHAAEAGSGARDTSTLHRIDPEVVKSEVTGAGFVLEAQSDVLRNPQDPHTAGVRDASIRGKTDQFVFKFRKPKT